jgi:hypothetical protein
MHSGGDFEAALTGAATGGLGGFASQYLPQDYQWAALPLARYTVAQARGIPTNNLGFLTNLWLNPPRRTTSLLVDKGRIMDDWDFAVDPLASTDPYGYDALPVDIYPTDYAAVADDWDFAVDPLASTDPYGYDALPVDIYPTDYAAVAPSTSWLDALAQWGTPPETVGFQQIPTVDLTAMQDLAAQRVGAPSVWDAIRNRLNQMGGLAQTRQMAPRKETPTGPQVVQIPNSGFQVVTLPSGETVVVPIQPQKPETSPWLKYGLAALGGLAAFSDTRSRNKLMRQAAAQNQLAMQQAIQRQQAFDARRSQPFVYGSPAQTTFMGAR